MTRQRENFLLLMENWDSVARYADIAANSSGTATEKMKAYTDSIQAAEARVQAAKEEFALNFNITDLLKAFYNSLAYVIENVDKFGTILASVLLLTQGKQTLPTVLGGLSNGIGSVAQLGYNISSIGMVKKNSEETGFWEQLGQNVQLDLNDNMLKDFDDSLVTLAKSKGISEDMIDAMSKTQKNILNISNLEARQLVTQKLSGQIDDDIFEERIKQLANQKKITALEEEKIKTAVTENTVDKDNMAHIQQNMQQNSTNNAKIAVARGVGSLIGGVVGSYGGYQFSQQLGIDGILGGLVSGASGAVSSYGWNNIFGGIESFSNNYQNIKNNNVEQLVNYNKQLEELKNKRNIFAEYLKSDDYSEYTLTIQRDMGILNRQIIKTENTMNQFSKATSGTMGNIKNFGKAALSAFGGIPGVISIAISAVTAFYSAWNAYNTATLNNMKESFKEAQQSYTDMLQVTPDVAKFDKLVEGVDSLGRNISLTDEEYQEFLNINTELAQAFPDLIVRTDGLGQAFVGVGGKVVEMGATIDEELEKAKVKVANAQLEIKEGFAGIGYVGLFSEDLDKAQEAWNKWRKLVNMQQHNIDTSYYSPERKAKDDKEIQNAYERYKEISKKTLDGTRDALLDTDSILEFGGNRYDSSLKDMVAGLTDEQRQLYDTIIDNLDYTVNELGETDLNDVRVMDRMKQKMYETLQEIKNDPEIQKGVGLYFNPESDQSIGDYSNARETFLNAILANTNWNLNEKKDILVPYHFTYDEENDKWIDEDNPFKSITNEGLDKRLTAKDTYQIKNTFSVEQTKTLYQILKNIDALLEDGIKVGLDEISNAIAITSLNLEDGLSKVADKYEELNNKKDLNKIETVQKEIVEKQLDKWAKELGAIPGKYDEIIEKIRVMGDLDSIGTTDESMEDIQSRREQYETWAKYLANDFDTSTMEWDPSTLQAMLKDESLLPYIVAKDIEGLKAKIQENLDLTEKAYQNSYQGILASSEAFMKDLIENNAETVKKFKEDYEIDLTNFETIQDAKVAIEAGLSIAMQADFVTWVSEMAKHYDSDLKNFGTAAQKKTQMNKLLLDDINRVNAAMGFSQSPTYANFTQQYQSYELREAKTGLAFPEQMYGVNTRDANGNLKDMQTLAQEIAYKESQELSENQLQAALDGIKELMNNYNIKTTTPSASKPKDSSSKDTDLPDEKWDELARLQALDSLIDKEWEAMKVFNQLTGEPYKITVTVDDYGVEDFFNEYMSTLKEAQELGVDTTKTIYGNIDTNNRQVLEWTQEMIDKYRWQLSQIMDNPDDMLGSYSTVLGSYDYFTEQHIPIAYVSMLQTDDGPVLLSEQAIHNYIDDLITKASELGDWTTEDLLALDSQGLDKFGLHIHDLIADLGDTAELTSESMHFTGKDGALGGAYLDLQEAAQKAGISIEALNKAIEENNIASILETKTVDMVTEYFEKKAKSLNEQLEATIKKTAQQKKDFEELKRVADSYGDAVTKEAIEARNDAGDAEKELIDLQKQQIELQKEINNLDDEEVQDRITIAESMEYSIETMIKLYTELLNTSDTQEEMAQNAKKLRDLYKEQYTELRRIRDYYSEIVDMTKELYSGSAWSNSADYDTMQGYREAYNQQKLQDILTERNRLYSEAVDRYVKEEYSLEEAMKRAMESSDVVELSKEYLETIRDAGQIIVDGIDDKVSEIQDQLDLIEKGRPSEWSNINQIKTYYGDTVGLLNQKISELQAGLARASELTDDQIKSLVDQLNEAILAIKQAEIDMQQDIIDQQDKYFDAIINQVNRYIDDLNDQIDKLEDEYEPILKQLEDQNKERQRAINLEEKLQAVQNAEQEKQRVYREGRVMPSINVG